MELLKRAKNRLKDEFRLLYQWYGNLCATRPLPMIVSSVTLVVLCSLPLLSHPVFERTATFLFGRIQIGKYQTNVSLIDDFNFGKSDIIIQQLNVKLNASVVGNDRSKALDTWMVFQRSFEKSGIKGLQSSLRRGYSGWWTSACLHVSRKPFYKSPQTRLIYPRGRFYKELRKWFSERGCLLVSPFSIFGIKSRSFSDLPESFKELLIGYPLNESGLSSPSQFMSSHRYQFTVTFFMKQYVSSFSRAIHDHLKSRNNSLVTQLSEGTYRISYMPVDNESDMELILLSFTYVLVFMYILFSVGKSDVLKSRWGLAFSAVMTIIMSMIMALGVCASLDLLPTTFSIKEIFPYVVIVIGLENVMIITNSVVSIERDIDVSARVAKGMGKEGWYITKNICAELTILGAGYYTHIPSVQEFCIFAFVGVLSDFFLQMVFFAPILAVDIRRAEICHLEQITTVQQFAVGFNLMQKTALKLVPPSPPKTRWSKFLDLWLRRRLFQKALMAAALAYIIYALCNKGETSSSDSSNDHDKTQAPTSFPFRDTKSSEKEGSGMMFNAKTNMLGPEEAPSASDSVLQEASSENNPGIGGDIYSNQANENCTVSWKFLSKQHWPELLSFYHIRFHERSLVVLPTIDVSMSLNLSESDQTSSYKFTDTSSSADFLLVLSIVISLAIVTYTVFLIYTCLSKRHRRGSRFEDDDLFLMKKKIFKGHSCKVDMVLSDGLYVVSTSLDGQVRVFDLNSSECIMELQSNARNGERRNSTATLRHRRFSNTDVLGKHISLEPITSVWSFDCRHNIAAIGYSTGNIEIYNVAGRKLIGRFKEEEVVMNLKIASRNTIVAGRCDGILDIIEVKRHQLDSVEDFVMGDNSPGVSEKRADYFGCHIKHRIRSHIGPIEHVAIFAGLVLTAAADMIKVYEIDDANCCGIISSTDNMITCLQEIKECSTQSVAVGYENGVISLIGMSGEKSFDCPIHDLPVLLICASAKRLASVDCDDRICLWSIEDGSECIELNSPSTDVQSMAFLDEDMLCVISAEGMSFYDAINGRHLFRINSSCDSRETRPVCFAQRCSVIMADRKSLEYLTFPNLLKRDNGKEVR